MNTYESLKILEFSNETNEDKKNLKRFVDFHWDHYRDDPQYVPLLDYEYLGFKLIGIHGFFESTNLFFKHADMRFFLAERDGKIVGRCNAFVNHSFNAKWKEKTGFFGQFETIDDQTVADRLIASASKWLKDQGMTAIRGPQNLPVNEATPGILTEGFDSRPVMYYHYNKPYYKNLLEKSEFKTVKRVKSWEVPVMTPMEDKLIRLAEKIIERYGITIETWDERPLDVRKKEMLEIYNEAWNDNWGFVPFTEEEFNLIVDDMTLILDKGLFIFLYIKGEPAAFFGGVPNATEFLGRIGRFRHLELIRAVKMILGAKRTKGFRLGYLGVKPKFRRLGLDGVMLWQQKKYSQSRKYEYCDFGWVLEDNFMVTRMAEVMHGKLSKVYTVYEKEI